MSFPQRKLRVLFGIYPNGTAVECGLTLNQDVHKLFNIEKEAT